METEQDNKTKMKDDINETVEVEKDDTSDVNEDRQTSSLKMTLPFFKTWSCLLTSILLLIIVIIVVTTFPPGNLTEQGNKVKNTQVKYFETIIVKPESKSPIPDLFHFSLSAQSQSRSLKYFVLYVLVALFVRAFLHG